MNVNLRHAASVADAGRDAPRIVSIRVRAVKAPFERPLKTASGVMEAAPLVLLDIETSANCTGHAYAFCYTPVVQPALTELTRSVGALLEGQFLHPASVMEALRRRFILLGTRGLLDMVLATIDTALWDAHAKWLGKPLVEVLGGAARPLPAYASFGMEDGETLVQLSTQAVTSGFKAVKIKLGHESFADDLAIVRAVKSAIGDVFLLIDYNQSLGSAEALRRCRALDDEGLFWIEEPCRYDNMEGHAAVTAAATTPLQLGENLWGPVDVAQSMRAKASDLMMPDLMKVGGVTGWMQVAAMCHAARMPVSNHFFQEASAHVMAVTPTAQLVEYFDLAGPVLRRSLDVRDGYVQACAEPGTGVEWNEEAIQQYAV